MTTEMERLIAEETAKLMRPLNLRRTHEILGDVRRTMKAAADLFDDQDPLAVALRQCVDNEIENLMWLAEQTIRNEKSA